MPLTTQESKNQHKLFLMNASFRRWWKYSTASAPTPIYRNSFTISLPASAGLSLSMRFMSASTIRFAT